LRHRHEVAVAPHVDLLRLVGVVFYRAGDGVRRSFSIAYDGRWVSLDRMPRLRPRIEPPRRA
jgi:hypothetical protein